MQRKDYYYKKAKEEGYRSRAAYKLKQINERFYVIKRGDVVVDLGAAPGGWLQVAKELSVDGKVVGIDINEIKEIEGVVTIKGDICNPCTLKKIKEVIKEKADVVICDAAPELSGNWSYDHARSIELSRCALEFALKLLKPEGRFVVKVFQGDMFMDFMREVKKYFKKVRAFSPHASRKHSAEMYIIGKYLKLNL